MSILIKGMEMPQEISELRFAKGLDGFWYARRIDVQIADWHEIIEVPTPHGRLVDVDDLMRIIEEHQYLLVDYFNSKDYGMFTNGIRQAVDETSTVIEAEE